MHTVKVMGEVPSTLKALGLLLRGLPEKATLTYQKDLLVDPESDWTGPLADAPDRSYDLLQRTGYGDPYFCQLLVVDGAVYLEGVKVAELHRSGEAKFFLEHDVLRAFRELLSTSNKVLYVYEAAPGQRQYEMLWPEAPPPAEHPSSSGYKLLGKADLGTGRITPV